MATHSSTPAWKIPWMEEPGRLQSMGSLRVGHNWATLLSLLTFMHWRRKWQPTPVFLPRESQGRGSLVGCCLWGHTESDMTEVTQQQQQKYFYNLSFYFLKIYMFKNVSKSVYQHGSSITLNDVTMVDFYFIHFVCIFYLFYKFYCLGNTTI